MLIFYLPVSFQQASVPDFEILEVLRSQRIMSQDNIAALPMLILLLPGDEMLAVCITGGARVSIERGKKPHNRFHQRAHSEYLLES